MADTTIGGFTLTPAQGDMSSDRALLAESRIFDEPGYIARAGEEARPDPIAHYLETGWRIGLEPNGSFPGSVLQPYFGTLTGSQPPAITWLVLRSAGWPMPDTAEQLAQTIRQVRETGLFDDAFYAAQLGPEAAGLDPAAHYVLIGERLGLSPSPEFDPRYYADRHPDVGQASVNFLLHYAEWGRREGRTPKPAQVLRPGKVPFDHGKENLILVCHETTRTGAPILGWNLAVELSRRYNLFFIHLGDGELTAAFAQLSVEMCGPFLNTRRDAVDIEYSLRPLLDARKYVYAIVNSASSRLVIEACARRFVPTVFLIHEFGSYVTPAASMHTALDMSTEVIFPAKIVAESAEELHPALGARSIHVIPQGMSVIPDSGAPQLKPTTTNPAVQALIRKHDEGAFLVLGAGALELRKGVEIFLSTAAAVQRRQPSRPVHFVWIGAGYRPREDFQYSVYLHEQLTRSGLSNHVTFVDPVPDLEPVYRITDAFFLSSRLDPLPNVTIDSAFRGIPVIAFRHASGMAEVMLETPETAATVVDYADTEAAAEVVLRLASDQVFRKLTADAFRKVAIGKFEMKSYIARLDAIGRTAEQKVRCQQADADTLDNDPTFDQEIFLGPVPIGESRYETILRYVVTGSDCVGDRVPPTYHRHRRPAPGFHPRLYAAAHADRLSGGVNALADFVRHHKPVGPWQAEVLLPRLPEDEPDGSSRLRVAVHAHFFYPELCELFLRHLASNRVRPDLLVTTDTEAKAAQLRRTLSRHPAYSAHVRVVPNCGRDIGPLLTGLAQDIQGYDLVGHVHGKRSPYTGNHSLSSMWGETWRDFLWQNLVGGFRPMMDRIVSAFEQDDRLGLVFPCDPNLCGWDENREIASDLASRMGWQGALPDHFEFPVGTMFWSRVPALAPLLDLHLRWEDYPSEPVARDGTLLHSLERLPVFACQLAGFHYAVTHVPGVSWIPPA